MGIGTIIQALPFSSLYNSVSENQVLKDNDVQIADLQAKIRTVKQGTQQNQQEMEVFLEMQNDIRYRLENLLK